MTEDEEIDRYLDQMLGTDLPKIALRPFGSNSDMEGLDDVVVEGVTMFRAEFMAHNSLWMACYFEDGERITFHVSTPGPEMTMSAGEMPARWQDFDTGERHSGR